MLNQSEMSNSERVKGSKMLILDKLLGDMILTGQISSWVEPVELSDLEAQLQPLESFWLNDQKRSYEAVSRSTQPLLWFGL